ncbi:ribosomal protein S6 kinase alpha-5-like [Scylla paramamosain]
MATLRSGKQVGGSDGGGGSSGGEVDSRDRGALQAADIKEKKLNWDDLAQKKVPAPFVPRISTELDVSNFSEEFTAMIPQDSPAIVPPDVEKMFNGYSYVAPSILFTDSVISDSSSLFKMSPDRRPSTTNLLLACSFKAHTYIVMKLLGGGELAASEDQETREVHRGSPRASVVVRNLVSAVHYVHRKGISVHGDLKPDRGEELGEGEEICWELMEWEGIKIEKWLVLRIDRKEKKGRVKKRKFFLH